MKWQLLMIFDIHLNKNLRMLLVVTFALFFPDGFHDEVQDLRIIQPGENPGVSTLSDSSQCQANLSPWKHPVFLTHVTK